MNKGNQENKIPLIKKLPLTLQIIATGEENWFDKAVTSKLKDLEEEYEQNELAIEYFDDVLGSLNDSQIENLFHLRQQNISILEQRFTLVSMNIIHLYKTLEIGIKDLINAAYGNVNSRQLYKWDYMKSFFKEKGILIKQLSSYSLINQLRVVNNDLKHSEGISEDTKNLNIREFKDHDNYSTMTLNNFFNRIKKIPRTFKTELANEILEERLVFNEERINKIANSYKNRMDRDALEKLAKNLTEY